jgi:RNA polymerase-binding transcription factor
MDHLSQQQLEELESDLHSLKQQLCSQLDNNKDQTKPVELDQQSFGRVSRIDAIGQQQMLKANREQNKQLLRCVNLALDSLIKGDYGYCQDCDELIAFARLKAQPASRLCIRCQEVRENS